MDRDDDDDDDDDPRLYLYFHERDLNLSLLQRRLSFFVLFRVFSFSLARSNWNEKRGFVLKKKKLGSCDYDFILACQDHSKELLSAAFSDTE